MQHHHRQPNLLGFDPRRPSTWLQGATLASVAGAVVAVWMFVWGPTPWVHQTADISGALSQTASASAELSPTPSSVPVLLGSAKVTAVANDLMADTVRYYEAGSGRSFSLNLRTDTVTPLLTARLPGFVDSWWAPQRDIAVNELTNKGVTVFRSFDYTTNKTAAIGSEVSSVAISPDGSQVAFFQPSADASILGVADITGDNTHTLVTTRAQSVRLSWPQKTSVYMSSQRSDRVGRDLTLVSPDGSLSPVMTNRQNLDLAWSHDGSKLLFSYFTSGQGVTLWLRNMATGDEVPLGAATSAKKCAWAPGDNVITCGVPNGTSLSSSSEASQTATNDDIVTLDLQSGTQQTLYRATGTMPLGVIDPVISSSGTYFVFTNIFDQKLYATER